MKKAFLICLSALVLMTFSSCSDSDDDANQTKSADMVRLVSFHNELVKGMFVLTTHLDNVWENGRLKRQTQIASALGKSVEVGEVFTYNERGLCTEMYTVAYTGYPIAIGIHDVTFLAMHCSKHNQIEPGLTPTYANGRLVLLTSDDGNDNTYFTYDDGTGKR